MFGESALKPRLRRKHLMRGIEDQLRPARAVLLTVS
jgi:hypothetical protein